MTVVGGQQQQRAVEPTESTGIMRGSKLEDY